MRELRDISKIYHIGDRRIAALKDLSICLPAGGFTVLVGPSGCGKTTLLRLLAGLETPTSGKFEKGPMAAGATGGDIGYVFQEPRLFPWLTVTQNIAFPIRRRMGRAEVQSRVGELLTLMGLTEFADLRPDHLSGGMASRVGLARALVTRPSLLLLDEPFGALDAMTRRRLQNELTDLWMRLKPTIVFVTHDIEEAVLLADTIYLMELGSIAAHYENPAPRPREPSDPGVVALRGEILADFEFGDDFVYRTSPPLKKELKLCPHSLESQRCSS